MRWPAVSLANDCLSAKTLRQRVSLRSMLYRISKIKS